MRTCTLWLLYAMLMPIRAIKMSAQSCSWPRSEDRDVMGITQHRDKCYKSGTQALLKPKQVFVGVCKKINLRESQGICNLTKFSSQYLCLYQFFSVYIFKEPPLKIMCLYEGLSKSLHVFLFKCKKSYWGLSVSLALA